MDLRDKLNILGDAAKYDVSCSSSGSKRNSPKGGMGCGQYDCAYCVNRRSNDIPRATFTPKELINLTLEFYRRNYIEGLFLSSAVIGSPDYTMELLIKVAKNSLTSRWNFTAAITLKGFS